MTCDEGTGSTCCEDLVTQRIRYFTGRHMTARDFSDGDAYHRTHRHLHNRMLHGWGVVCGLDVHHHARPECRGDRVVVRRGLALDCCGREIVVRRDVVAPHIPWDARASVEGGAGDEVLLLCLRRVETPVENVPVLYSPNACSSPAMEAGRICEGHELRWRWVREDDLAAYGWHTPHGCVPPEEGEARPERPGPAAEQGAAARRPVPPRPEHGGDDHGHHGEHPDHGPHHDMGWCLDLRCPPDGCVPLAIVRAAEGGEAGRPFEIDTAGRPSIAPAREHLTHICWISWPHGGIVKASELETLRVRFDRPLRAPEHPARPGPRGINERTFVVQFGEQVEGGQVEDLDFVEYERPPHLTEDRRMAVYEIARRHRYANHVLHVTLRCDFIVDRHGTPVDGSHLRGRLPTGNGTPGGTFESWFRVVSDADYERVVEKTRLAEPVGEEG